MIALPVATGCAHSEGQAGAHADSAGVAMTGSAAPAGDATADAAASAPIPGGKVLTAPSGPSTQVGVYTAEQAARGREVYNSACRSCHSPTSHTGQVFADWWGNKPVSDLFNFIMNNMPKNDPGTLAPQDAADLVAYLFQMNHMPTGKAELYPETDSLSRYWIDAGHSNATK